MSCFSPLFAWQLLKPNAEGKRPLSFSSNINPALYERLSLPCNKCLGCKFKRSQDWALRCVHEAQMHNGNSFITLTYNKKNLPDYDSLCKRDLQLFLKRFRKNLGSVRYFGCGEYGEQFGRPHYHLLLFGHQFDDLKHLKTTKSGQDIHRSKSLEDLWPHGWSSVGDLTFNSAAYVARYTLGQENGTNKEAHYNPIDPATGEIKSRLPEYNTMSLKPGIAQKWFDQYGMTDVFPGDNIVFQTRRYSTPRFYDRQLSEPKSIHYDPELLAQLKAIRKSNALKHAKNNTPARLKVRAIIQELKAKQLHRQIH